MWNFEYVIKTADFSKNSRFVLSSGKLHVNSKMKYHY